MHLNKIREYNSLNDIIILILAITTFVLTGLVNTHNEKPTITVEKQDSAINLDPSFIRYFNMGHRMLVTDLLWIQTLIESDTTHYTKKDLNNWLFLRFNSIAELDPKFYQNYLYGGQFLGIIKDDLEGADVIYQKGLNIFPDDYSLNYHAGFLNYYELGNFETGLKYLRKIKNHPRSPVFLQSIIHKLELEQGAKIEDIFSLVLHAFNTTKDESLKKKLRGDLYSIRAEIDLKCLNNNKTNCNRTDLSGNAYEFFEGSYRSSVSFLPYRINKRGATTAPQQNKPVRMMK